MQEPTVRYGDAVFDTLPFADQPRASDWPLVLPDPTQRDIAAIDLFAECFEASDGLVL